MGEGSASDDRWQDFLAAFKTSDYERVSDLLRIVGASAHTEEQSRLIQIASQVCLACIFCHSELEWHRQAVQEADTRERELRAGLETILEATIGKEGEQNEIMDQGLSRSPLLHLFRTRLATFQKMRLDIGKRIRAFLGFNSGRGISVEEGEDLIAPQVQEEEKRSRSEIEVESFYLEKVGDLEDDTPLLVVYSLGSFRVYQNEQPVEDWPSIKSKAIFKYLISHRERPVAKDILMELFWPDADLDSARNNLHVAVYGLRQVLRNNGKEFSHVLFQNDSYQFNPKLRIWTDHESFLSRIKAAQTLERQGELSKAVQQYTFAEALYQGEFLEEDRYEDWLMPQRRRLQDEYLNLLDHLTRYYFEHDDLTGCANMCHKMLAVDPCREEAHRRLMRCYDYQGQSYLALRQYHICSEALRKELDIVPSKATIELYELIRTHNGG